jgi:four helix bundle protein
MRRAAVSITNNMAEGYGRYTWKDRTHFFRQARGSLAEVVDDIGVCKDQGMVEADRLDTLRTEGVQLLQLINGYIRYLQRKKGADEQT